MAAIFVPEYTTHATGADTAQNPVVLCLIRSSCCRCDSGLFSLTLFPTYYLSSPDLASIFSASPIQRPYYHHGRPVLRRVVITRSHAVAEGHHQRRRHDHSLQMGRRQRTSSSPQVHGILFRSACITVWSWKSVK